MTTDTEHTGLIDDINYCADLDEQLGYDADHSDASQYCRHGKWIGSWWGPDYLCGYCEEGLSKETGEYLEVLSMERRARSNLKEAMAWYGYGRVVWDVSQGRHSSIRWKFLLIVMEKLDEGWPKIKEYRAILSRVQAERKRLETPEILAELERAYT